MNAKDYASDQEVRWCPGCGDYVVLATMQRLLAELGAVKENTVFITGIGCASRFVYYIDTYGFHTIHGRATAVATGLKAMRPELDVWIVTGDGDSLSIGLGHLLHLMRRNIDVKILLLNNEIYGLTKGQFSPTSKLGTISSSSPYGTVDQPFNPVKLALAAECSFVARTMDPDPKHLTQVLRQAALHKGTAFVEVLQNCNVYNFDAFAKYRDQQFRAKNCIYLEDNAVVKFGAQAEHALTIENLQPKIVANSLDVDGQNLLIHQESSNSQGAIILAELGEPDFPLVLGIFRAIGRQTHTDTIIARKAKAINQHGVRSASSLF